MSDTDLAAQAAAALAPEVETTDVVFNSPRALGGVDYPAGPRAVAVPTAAIEADRWFYDACLEDGSIVEPAPQRAADGTPRARPVAKTPARRR